MPSFIEQVWAGQSHMQDMMHGEQATQINQLKIQQEQLKQQQQQQMMDLMKQKAGQKGMDLADQLDTMAGIAAETGNITAAEKLSTKGSTIREKSAAVVKNYAQAGQAEAKTEESPVNKKLMEARARYYDARAENLRKTGVKAVAADRVLAEKSIQNDYPGIPEEQAYIYSAQIVERAKDLMRSNAALDKPTAIARAYREMEKTEVFAPYRHAKPPGGSLANPLAVPDTREKLVKGRYYTSPSGSVGKWNGKGFEITESSSNDEEEADQDE